MRASEVSSVLTETEYVSKSFKKSPIKKKKKLNDDNWWLVIPRVYGSVNLFLAVLSPAITIIYGALFLSCSSDKETNFLCFLLWNFPANHKEQGTSDLKFWNTDTDKRITLLNSVYLFLNTSLESLLSISRLRLRMLLSSSSVALNLEIAFW